MKKYKYLCPHCNNELQCSIKGGWLITDAFCFTCNKNIDIKKIKIKQDMTKEQMRTILPYCIQCGNNISRLIGEFYCFTCSKSYSISFVENQINKNNNMEESHLVTLQMGKTLLHQPENTKITITQESGVMVALVEPMQPENPKFKKGDIVFRSRKGCAYELIFICDGYNDEDHFFSLSTYSTEYKELDYGTTPILTGEERLATESEKQILFNALAKYGKRYNAEKHCIEVLPKKILVPENKEIYKGTVRSENLRRSDTLRGSDNLLVPENIEIYKKIGSDDLHLRISDNQLLGYNHSVGNYSVTALSELDLKTCYSRVKCELTPCEYSDIKKGELIFVYPKNLDSIENYIEKKQWYLINLGDEDCYVDNKNIKVVKLSRPIPTYYYSFKVTPIK